MLLSQQQLSDLQKKELELLRLFIDICSKLNITYYVTGGTLLGAVRHQGFIPWDDDIDLCMTREDYEVFINSAQDYLPDGFFLQTYTTDPDYPCNFAKLRNSNTTFVENSIKHHKINHGIYIDIFPIDYYPSKRKWLFILKAVLMKLRITYAYSIEKMKLRTHIARFFARMIYPSLSETIIQREKLFKSVTDGDYLINHSGIYGKREIIPAQWFKKGTYLSFEGIQVHTISHYHELLTQLYGDYMQLPPEDKRVPHHYIAAFDLDKSYTQYL